MRKALSSLAGDFGRESMLSLQRFFSSRREPVISTGSLKLDLALGIGGLPKVMTCWLSITCFCNERMGLFPRNYFKNVNVVDRTNTI